jgi:hypothetical protein
MKIGNGWMQAYTLTGMWSVAGTVPHGAEPALARVIRDTGTAGLDLLDDQSLEVDEAGFAITPAVHVSTTPAALIVTRGEPEFEPVDGTKLLYMKNTAGRVLEEPTDQELYVQVSGEWYRAWTESGPWQRVAAQDLPADFASALKLGAPIRLAALQKPLQEEGGGRITVLHR